MIAHESIGEVMVIYVSRKGGPNVIKTYIDRYELEQTVVRSLTASQITLGVTARLPHLSIQELSSLETLVQAEWDRRAIQRIKQSHI